MQAGHGGGAAGVIMYYYQEIFPDTQIQKTGGLSVVVSSLLAGVPQPLLRFYVESPTGTIERPRPVLGFCTFLYNKPAIFIKADQSPQSLVETIFHEVFHGKILYDKRQQSLSREQRERDAREFESSVPHGSTYREIHSELARRMVKWWLQNGDLERAREYHRELKSVDPEAAAKLSDSLLTPGERRLKIRVEAEQMRREAAREVWLQEKIADMKRWSDEQDRRSQNVFGR
jgi:hypothetical protein